MDQNYKKYSGIKLLILLLLTCYSVQAQVENQYFQQKVDNIIRVSLHDSTHSLRGEIRILYHNNSPDTLHSIWFHLYPNAYKNQSTALALQKREMHQIDFYFSKSDMRGYIDSMAFTTNSEDALIVPHEKHIDIAELKLNAGLAPGDSLVIQTPFYVKLPYVFSRLGHIEQSYYITQWFPKPAVYDKHGWHAFPYLDMGEFYSEFGDYDVYITLPSNYRVAASGQLQNQKEREWLTMLPDAKTDEFPESSKEIKTLHFKAQNVHDFAWFADKRFCVRHERYNKDKEIWTFFLPESKQYWVPTTKTIRQTLDLYTKEIGELPYPSISAVQGRLGIGGGMEYPGVTIISHSARGIMLENVVMHEVGHNWFYGVLGFNERRYPWLDEGLNSYYEHKYMQTYHPELRGNNGLFPFAGRTWNKTPNNLSAELYYLLSQSLGSDQSPNLPSSEFEMINYFSLSYKKTVASFYHLQHALGEEKMQNIMQSFYQEWKNKHPGPSDLRHHFEKESGKNLDWFFDGFMGSTEHSDYSIKSYKKDEIILKNRGNIPAPLSLKVKDSTILIDGFTGKKSISFPNLEKGDVIQIDPDYQMLEYNRLNNNYQLGTFPKSDDIKFRFLGGINDFDNHNIYIAPVPAFNAVNGFMPGLFFSNSFLPIKTFEYRIMPLYGVKTNTLTGSVQFDFRHWTSQSDWLKGIHISSHTKSFGLIESLYFIKSEQSLNLEFQPWKHNQKLDIDFKFISTSVSTQSPKYYQQISFCYEEFKPPYPFKIELNAEHGKAYYKFWLESNIHVPYTQSLGLDIRLFAGSLHYYDFDNYPNNVNFRLAGTSTNSDYLYELTLLNRSVTMNSPEVLGARQFVPDQGGFVLYTPISSHNQMVSLNLSSATMFKFLRIYANFASFPGLYNTDFYEANILYESGIELQIFKDILEIYFPVTASESLEKINKNIYSSTYFERVRFRLSLDLVNPWDLRFKTHLLF